MDYPDDFPPESRAAVAAERLRAARDFDAIRKNPPRTEHGFSHDWDAELRKYILRQFIVFVREACKLGRAGVWQVDRIEEASMEFLRLATIDTEFGKGSGLVGRSWTENWHGQIQPEVMRRLERSAEYQQYRDALLEIAEIQEAQTRGNLSATADLTLVQQRALAVDPEADRRKIVDAFLNQCTRESGVGFKVTRKHIWLVAGHSQPRQFQYWQGRSSEATEEDDRNFQRILSMPPGEFIGLLKRKGIFSSNS